MIPLLFCNQHMKFPRTEYDKRQEGFTLLIPTTNKTHWNTKKCIEHESNSASTNNTFTTQSQTPFFSL